MQQKVTVEDAYFKVLELIDKTNISYLVIGGIAAGALGEPRNTVDVDFNIIFNPGDIETLLKRAQKMDFYFNEAETLQRVKRQVVLRWGQDRFHYQFH